MARLDPADIRNCWQHEDNLINQRLSWLTAAQAILLGFYTSDGTAGPETLIPLMGLLSTGLMYVSLLAAVLALARLYREREPGPFWNPPPISEGTLAAGLAAPVLVPLVFLSLWIHVLDRLLGEVIPLAVLLAADVVFLAILGKAFLKAWKRPEPQAAPQGAKPAIR